MHSGKITMNYNSQLTIKNMQSFKTLKIIIIQSIQLIRRNFFINFELNQLFLLKMKLWNIILIQCKHPVIYKSGLPTITKNKILNSV